MWDPLYLDTSQVLCLPFTQHYLLNEEHALPQKIVSLSPPQRRVVCAMSLPVISLNQSSLSLFIHFSWCGFSKPIMETYLTYLFALWAQEHSNEMWLSPKTSKSGYSNVVRRRYHTIFLFYQMNKLFLFALHLFNLRQYVSRRKLHLNRLRLFNVFFCLDLE